MSAEEWAAVHLSYLKELDLLMAKKAEIRRGPKAVPKAENKSAESPQDPLPKRKPRFPRKPKAPPAEEEG